MLHSKKLCLASKNKQIVDFPLRIECSISILNCVMICNNGDGIKLFSHLVLTLRAVQSFYGIRIIVAHYVLHSRYNRKCNFLSIIWLDRDAQQTNLCFIIPLIGRIWFGISLNCSIILQ